MLKPQKRMRKKEIKEDKFVKAMMEVRAYAEENSKMVTIVLGAIFALVIAFMIFNSMHSQKVEMASTLLGEAQIEYQNMNFSKSEKLLTRLLDEYDGTEAAGQGRFLLANIYYQENKTAQALDQYKKFVNSYDGSQMLLASGYAGIGACLENQKKYSQAAENYLTAQKTAPNFVEAADFLYSAALNFISAGSFSKAKAALTLITKKYKDSPRIQDAQAKLILIANK